MNLLPKLVISIATTFMIATVSLEIFAISNNNNDYILTTPTPTKKVSFLSPQLIIDNNSNKSTINNTVASNNTNTSKSIIKVVASFYPIYEFVKAVGGDRVQASVLIPIGSEPHSFRSNCTADK